MTYFYICTIIRIDFFIPKGFIKMLVKDIYFAEKYPYAYMTAYICGNSAELRNPPRKAIVICPGGAYEFLSDREAEPIAKLFLNAGLNCFVLRYGIRENAKDCAPVIQSALAIKHIREHAEEYNIDPAKVFVIGFSAGGHVAGSCGILWNIPEVREALGDAPERIGRPDGMILCYPVITTKKGFTHELTTSYVCGKKDPDEAEREKFSLEDHVDSTTPPAFIWHTFNDACVPLENSLFLANALRKNNIPFELHIYPDGTHGLSLASAETSSGWAGNINTHVQSWTDLVVKWINDCN